MHAQSVYEWTLNINQIRRGSPANKYQWTLLSKSSTLDLPEGKEVVSINVDISNYRKVFAVGKVLGIKSSRNRIRDIMAESHLDSMVSSLKQVTNQTCWIQYVINGHTACGCLSRNRWFLNQGLRFESQKCNQRVNRFLDGFSSFMKP